MRDWGVIEWILAVCGSVSAMVMWGTQVSPKQAISHAAEWAHTFGFKNLPDWLQSVEADRIIRHVAGLILLLSVSLIAVQVVDVDAMHKMTKLLFGVAALSAAIGIVANLVRPTWIDSLWNPSFFVALGLAIAILGIMWQWRRTSPPDPQIAILQTQVDALKQRLAAPKPFVDQQAPSTSIATVPHPSIANPKAEPAERPKFYSRQDEEELAEALRDLRIILNGPAADIQSGTHKAIELWRRAKSGQYPSTKDDIRTLYGLLVDLYNKTARFNGVFFDPDGFFKKYKIYNEEMTSIVQLPQNNAGSGLAALQQGIGNFRDTVATIDLATQYDNSRLMAEMIKVSDPAHKELINGDSAFRSWVGEIEDRISKFRQSLGLRQQADATPFITTRTPLEIVAPFKTLSAQDAREVVKKYFGNGIERDVAIEEVIPTINSTAQSFRSKDTDGVYINGQFAKSALKRAQQLREGDQIRIRGIISSGSGPMLVLDNVEIVGR